MKRLINLSFTFIFLFILSATAQIPMDAGQKSGKSIDANAVHAVKPLSQQNHQRGTFHFQLDYDAAEQVYADGIGSDYFFTGFPLNSTYDGDDTSTLNWAAVRFDTIYDYVDDVSYNLSNVTITVDTVFIGIAHSNHTGTDNTIVMSILELAGANGITINGNQQTATNTTNTILYQDTIVTNTSIGPFPSINVIFFALDTPLLLPPGEGFGIKLDYFGPEMDTLYMVSGARDDCFGSCVAEFTIFEENSWYRENFIFSDGFDASGVNNPFGIFFDCDGSGLPPTIGGCERVQKQNFLIWSAITIDAPLSAGASATETTICPGETTTLNANPSGGTLPFSVSWDPATNLSNPGDEQTDAAPTTTTTYTATVADGVGDTVTSSVTITVAAIAVDVGPDQTIPCGTQATLQASASGVTTGVSYNWSNGVASFNNPNLDPGTYTVTVTNSFGCTATDAAVVSYAGVNGSVSFTPPDTVCKNDPATFVSSSVGLSGWDFQWDFGGGSLVNGTTAVFTFTTIGNKTVTLNADSGSCHLDHSVIVFVNLETACDPTIGIESVSSLSGRVEVFPNPSEGEFDIMLSDFNDADLTITIYSLNGQQVYKNQLTVNGSEILDLDMSHLANGHYLVKVEDGEGIATQKLSLVK